MRLSIAPLFSLFIFTGCFYDPLPGEAFQDKTPTISSSLDLTLQVGQQSTIQGKNLSAEMFWCRNETVAELSEELIVTAKHVGQTWIYGPSSSITVTVLPSVDFSMPLIYDVYPYYDPKYKSAVEYQFSIPNLDPVFNGLSFGLDIEVFKLKVAVSFPEHKLYKSNGTQSLIYSTQNEKTPYAIYTFKNQKLAEVGILVSMDYINEIPAFLNERYYIDYVDLNNYRAYFSHKEEWYDHNKQRFDTFTDYVGGIAYNHSPEGILIGFMRPS